MARRCWSCTNSIPRRKLSTVPSPGWRVGCPRRSRNWTSFLSPWARAWDGHEVVDLAVGRLALHYATQIDWLVTLTDGSSLTQSVQWKLIRLPPRLLHH